MLAKEKLIKNWLSTFFMNFKGFLCLSFQSSEDEGHIDIGSHVNIMEKCRSAMEDIYATDTALVRSGYADAIAILETKLLDLAITTNVCTGITYLTIIETDGLYIMR